MVEEIQLPETVAFCLRMAQKSGRSLSWKIQESSKGILVQLIWKAVSPIAEALDPRFLLSLSLLHAHGVKGPVEKLLRNAGGTNDIYRSSYVVKSY